MNDTEAGRKNGGMATAAGVILLSLALLAGYFMMKRSGAGLGQGGTADGSPGPGEWSVGPLSGGTPLGSSSLEGEVVVLHFWASWCPPCRAEFPEFARWAAENSGRDGLKVVPVSLDGRKEEGAGFISKNAPSLECWHDEGAAADKFKIVGIPATVILDGAGRVVFKKEGAIDWDNGEVSRVVEGAMKN